VIYERKRARPGSVQLNFLFSVVTYSSGNYYMNIKRKFAFARSSRDSLHSRVLVQIIRSRHIPSIRKSMILSDDYTSTNKKQDGLNDI